MQETLFCHPDDRPSAVTKIVVDVTCNSRNQISIDYKVSCATGDLLLPKEKASARADDLWQHTCFELFVRPKNQSSYLEFNFSPSSEWAAYRFEGYRTDRADVDIDKPPIIEAAMNDNVFGLQALIDLASLQALTQSEFWQVGLSAVIEETNGQKSYWACAHPPVKPDFHHADCFCVNLDLSEIS